MKKTLLAVTTFNQAKYTRQCFESLRDTPIKVICIDDASTDSTQAVCEEFNIEFIGRKKAKGLTYSWNLAYRYFLESDFDYLIISNNDVLFPKGSLEALTDCLSTHDYVSPLTRRNEAGVWSDQFGVETYYDVSSEIINAPENFQKVQNLISRAPLPTLSMPLLYGFCFGVSRKIQKYEFSKNHLFNPKCLNIGQENDLAKRVPEKFLCRSAFVYHYKGKSFEADLPFRNKNIDYRESFMACRSRIARFFFKVQNLFRKEVNHRNTVVMVIGMHRSGTSAVAGMLHTSGICMGEEEKLIPKPLPENKKGFFENYDFRKINDLILKHSNYEVKSWDKPGKCIIPSWLDRIKIRNLLRKYAKKNKPWGWKDPRMCLTLGAWLNEIKSMRADLLQKNKVSYFLKVIFVYRDPRSVAKSLVHRNKISYRQGLALWRIYNHHALMALKDANCHPFFLRYEELMQNPQETVERLFKHLALKPDKQRILAFLDPQLNHQSFRDSKLEEELPKGVFKVWKKIQEEGELPNF